MTSTKLQRWERPLYIFVKPPAERLRELRRLRAMLGTDCRYALERLHSTFLALGEATSDRIRMASDLLAGFHAEPFDIVFDHLEGSTLKPRTAQLQPGILHRALARHFAVAGFDLPAYAFGLHLNLDYGTHSERRVSIPPLAWTVDELLLIESAYGQHIVHGRYPLILRQYAFAL